MIRRRTRKSKLECKEVKTEKYQKRKSPPFHAAHCVGQIKKGKDGMYISKESSNGVFKWVKYKAIDGTDLNSQRS